MPVLVRELRPSDCPPIAHVVATLPLLLRYGVTAAGLARDLELGLARDETILAAEEAGRLVGFAWVVPRGAFVRGAYLRLIAVAPEAQARGIGKALLAEAERRAQGSSLFLLVSDFNQAGQRFYEAQGYERVGALRGFVLPDVDELLYWKRLGDEGA